MVWPVIFVVFCAIFWTNNFFGQTISFQNKIAIFFNASEEKFHKDSHNQRYYNIKICDDRRLVVTSSFAFYVITFEPIEVQTRSAPQNDRLNLRFVKDTSVNGRKLARNGPKTTIYISRVSQVRKNIFAFCVITSESIELQTRSAPQNDRLNLSFVKYINGQKWSKNGNKGGRRVRTVTT
jgi:hypothetical protein